MKELLEEELEIIAKKEADILGSPIERSVLIEGLLRLTVDVKEAKYLRSPGGIER